MSPDAGAAPLPLADVVTLGAHDATRIRERVMRRFRSATSAQRFLEAFSRVANRLRPGRHRLRAGQYRATVRERAATWRAVAGLRAA